MAARTCVYTIGKGDGYGQHWATACGHDLYCETPEEVGICFPALPTDDDWRFCPHCGGALVLNPPEGRGQPLSPAAFARALAGRSPPTDDDDIPPR